MIAAVEQQLLMNSYKIHIQAKTCLDITAWKASWAAIINEAPHKELTNFPTIQTATYTIIILVFQRSFASVRVDKNLGLFYNSISVENSPYLSSMKKSQT